MRAFMIEAKNFDAESLLQDWRWLVSPDLTPLMISAFGDWVFGAPDGSIWALSALEGTIQKVASSASEFNTLKTDFAWLDRVFIAGWQEIAARQGLEPAQDECLGWKVHPLMGGKFEVANLQVFSLIVYQTLMGQLHRQVRRQPTP